MYTYCTYVTINNNGQLLEWIFIVAPNTQLSLNFSIISFAKRSSKMLKLIQYVSSTIFPHSIELARILLFRLNLTQFLFNRSLK